VPDLHERRNHLMDALEREGIATRQGTHAAVLAGQFRARADEFPASVAADRLTLALPLYPQMTDDEQARVVEALKRLGP
jgi:perosamine synthetase